MKKFLSIMLVLTLVLSLGVSSFAATPLPTEETSISLDKVYKITNADTCSPAETFTFTIEKFGVTDSTKTLDTMPDFAIKTYLIPFSLSGATTEGATGSATLILPQYDTVGIYTYKISETQGNTLGVSYDATDLYLIVQVAEVSGQLVANPIIRYGSATGQKSDKTTNLYSAGKLNVTKTVTGNFGDKSKYFSVDVTFTNPTGKVWTNIICMAGGSKYTPTTYPVFDSNNKITIELKDGDTITFNNIPYGVTYIVDENDYSGEGYTTSGEVPSATTVTSASSSVTINNHKDKSVDTGISLDSIPYILLLAGALIGMALLFIKKRQNANY